MTLRTVFLNQSGRLRSGWRFAIFLLSFVLAGVLFGLVAETILKGMSIGYAPRSAIFLTVNGVVSLLCALVIGWLCGKYLDDLPFRALGTWFTKGWFGHLLLGTLAGVLSIGLAVLIAVVFSGLSFQLNTGTEPSAILTTLAISLVVFTVAAAFEEVLFRGYMLQTFTRAGLIWFGVVLTSVLFATVHNANPSATVFSWLNTFLAGVWFGVGYLKTRDLWFVFGMHLMWNWLQGSVFGIEVSGLTAIVTPSLFEEIDRGPTWLTGENYGIEGGIACTIALLASIAAIYFLPILKPSEEMLRLTSTESATVSVELGAEARTK